MRVVLCSELLGGGGSRGLAFTPNFGPSSLAPIFPVNLKPIAWPPRTLGLDEFLGLMNALPVMGVIQS